MCVCVCVRAQTTEYYGVCVCVRMCVHSDVTVIVLDRPRHKDIISQIREAGARIRMISDGDVAGAIEVRIQHTHTHTHGCAYSYDQRW